MSGPGTVRRILLHGGAALLVAGTLAAASWLGYRELLGQPLRRVVFAGDVDRLPHVALEALGAWVQSAPPQGRPLAEIREAARKVPWVREASVRRRYPDVAEITFQAHEAFARWNDGAFVSRRGEVFVAPNAGPMPMLGGPEGAAPLVVAEYPRLAAALAPIGALAELRLSPRGAWQARLDSGLAIELGRGEVLARAARFVAAWSKLPEETRQTRHADLRYPNGFALRVAMTPSPTLPQGGGRTARTTR